MAARGVPPAPPPVPRREGVIPIPLQMFLLWCDRSVAAGGAEDFVATSELRERYERTGRRLPARFVAFVEARFGAVHNRVSTGERKWGFYQLQLLPVAAAAAEGGAAAEVAAAEGGAAEDAAAAGGAAAAEVGAAEGDNPFEAAAMNAAQHLPDSGAALTLLAQEAGASSAERGGIERGADGGADGGNAAAEDAAGMQPAAAAAAAAAGGGGDAGAPDIWDGRRGTLSPSQLSMWESDSDEAPPRPTKRARV